MTFKVDPIHLQDLSNEFRALVATVPYAYFNVETDMSVDSVGGWAFGMVVGDVNDVRDDLLLAYEPGGKVETLFQGACDTLMTSRATTSSPTSRSAPASTAS